jgi:hypothetical protein
VPDFGKSRTTFAPAWQFARYICLVHEPDIKHGWNARRERDEEDRATLEIAAFLLMLSVTPTAGHQPAASAAHDRSACPQKTARSPSSSSKAAVPPMRRVTTITLPDRVGGPVFNIDRRASAFDL